MRDTTKALIGLVASGASVLVTFGWMSALIMFASPFRWVALIALVASIAGFLLFAYYLWLFRGSK